MSKSLTFQFEAYLTRAGIKETELSASIKKKIKDVRTVQGSIPELQRDLEVEGLSDKKKTQLQTKIAELEAAVPLLDEEVLQAIKKWEPKREQYAEAGRRLQAAQGKKGTPPAEPAPQPAPEPAPEPAPQPSPTPAKQDEPPADEKKKKVGPLGWFLIVAGALVLGTAGVALARRANERAGL